jgi:hypothetical protein
MFTADSAALAVGDTLYVSQDEAQRDEMFTLKSIIQKIEGITVPSADQKGN